MLYHIDTTNTLVVFISLVGKLMGDLPTFFIPPTFPTLESSLKNKRVWEYK